MGGRAQKYYFIQYVPKYHQKLGCQANGGARAGRAPPRSANVTIFSLKM